MTGRRLSLIALAFAASLTACVSPFSDHAQDVRSKWERDAEEMHRKWDRYFMNLDWDDPWHDWEDESFARGPMHRH